MNRIPFVLVLLAASVYEPAHAQTNVVVPNWRTNLEGNSDSGVPMRSHPLFSRSQQIYGASHLTKLVGREIRQIAFRLSIDSIADRGGFVYDDLVVRLSTTTAQVDQLSMNLDENVGADVTTVHSGRYVLPELRAATVEQPAPFDFVINFQQPFRYNGGNLLLDMPTQRGPESEWWLDGELEYLDPVSRVSVFNGIPHEYTFGLVTRFSDVPSPSVGAVLAACAAFWTRRRHR